jgi:hypothetical protein
MTVLLTDRDEKGGREAGGGKAPHGEGREGSGSEATEGQRPEAKVAKVNGTKIEVGQRGTLGARLRELIREGLDNAAMFQIV